MNRDLEFSILTTKQLVKTANIATGWAAASACTAGLAYLNYFWLQRGQPIFWTTYFSGAVLVAFFSLLVAATTRLLVFSIFSRFTTSALLLGMTVIAIEFAIAKLTSGVVAALVLACLSLIFAWRVASDQWRRNLPIVFQGFVNNKLKWLPGTLLGASLFVAFHLRDIYIAPSPGKTGLNGGDFELGASFAILLVFYAVLGGVAQRLLSFCAAHIFRHS